jgi:hypothetical protein
MNADLGEAPDKARRTAILRVAYQYAAATAREFGLSD